MQAIRTKYFGPTNSRGSCIQAKCEARTIYMPYRHELDIYENHNLVDTVFFTIGKKQTIADAIEEVRKGLINHDGYAPEIRVTWPKGQRVTVDSFELRGRYPGPHGEELLCAENTRKEARERLKEYRENDALVSGLRIVKTRERV